MIPDPIVEEIHRIREDVANECGGDIETFFLRLRKAEGASGHRLVTEVPHEAEHQQTAAGQ